MLTPWFDAFRNPPARIGWYDYIGWLLDPGLRLYWNGHHWGYWMGPGRSNWVHNAEVPTDRWRGKTQP